MREAEPMRVSNGLLDSPEALRARAGEDGYLFFKGLIDREKIFALRRQIVDILVRRGLVDASEGVGRETVIHETVDAQPREQLIEGAVTADLYGELQRLEAFHALPHDPALMGVYRVLFGERPLPHPRNIMRVMLPSPMTLPTPPHQDFHLIQGSTESWTCWIPLGDAPRELGPLAIMPGTHKAGPLEATKMPGAGGVGVKIRHLEPAWVETDYEAGDFVTFHSLTVHRALPHRMKDRIRLSMDARFQGESEPIQAMSLRPHFAPLPQIPKWPDIYAGWTGDTPRYYWRDYDLRFAPIDFSIMPDGGKLGLDRQTAMEAYVNDTTGLLEDAR